MELKIGNRYNYFDTIDSLACPCTLINIKYNVYQDIHIYEFKHDNSTAIGASVYPDKFKSLIKEERKAKLEKLHNNK